MGLAKTTRHDSALSWLMMTDDSSPFFSLSILCALLPPPGQIMKTFETQDIPDTLPCVDTYST